MIQRSKKNQRSIGSHALLINTLIADGVGAWATFSVGREVPSLILFVRQSGLALLSVAPPFPRVDLVPNMLSGWMWLAGYLLVHLLCFARQNVPKVPGCWVRLGEPERQTLRRCYQYYNKALDRWSPRPVLCLCTPKVLCSPETNHTAITWKGQTLVVPDLFLHPEQEMQLRMELARHLMYCNGPDVRIEQFLSSYPQKRLWIWSLALLLTGNFLCLPILVQARARLRWRRWRILDADRFAFLLGEGEVLRESLWHQRQAQHQAGIIDTQFPTLSERIDQLDALLADEHQQMRQLGIIVNGPESPVIYASKCRKGSVINDR